MGEPEKSRTAAERSYAYMQLVGNVPLKDQIFSDIKAGLDALRGAQVEPMELFIFDTMWRWYKFIPLPGHPRRGLHGWVAVVSDDVHRAAKREYRTIAGTGVYRSILDLSLPQDQAINQLACELLDYLDIPMDETCIDVARDHKTGELHEIVITRGGTSGLCRRHRNEIEDAESYLKRFLIAKFPELVVDLCFEDWPS